MPKKKTSQTRSTAEMSRLLRDLQCEINQEVIGPSEHGFGTIGPEDVLTGRGNRRSNQQNNGTAFFRELIEHFASCYESADNQSKPTVTKRIVEIVRSRGGKFLRHDNETMLYYDIGDESAKLKTSQALRTFTFLQRRRRNEEESAMAAAATTNELRGVGDQGRNDINSADEKGMVLNTTTNSAARSDHQPSSSFRAYHEQDHDGSHHHDPDHNDATTDDDVDDHEKSEEKKANAKPSRATGTGIHHVLLHSKRRHHHDARNFAATSSPPSSSSVWKKRRRSAPTRENGKEEDSQDESSVAQLCIPRNAKRKTHDSRTTDAVSHSSFKNHHGHSKDNDYPTKGGKGMTADGAVTIASRCASSASMSDAMNNRQAGARDAETGIVLGFSPCSTGSKESKTAKNLSIREKKLASAEVDEDAEDEEDEKKDGRGGEDEPVLHEDGDVAGVPKRISRSEEDREEGNRNSGSNDDDDDNNREHDNDDAPTHAPGVARRDGISSDASTASSRSGSGGGRRTDHSSRPRNPGESTKSHDIPLTIEMVTATKSTKPREQVQELLGKARVLRELAAAADREAARIKKQLRRDDRAAPSRGGGGGETVLGITVNLQERRRMGTTRTAGRTGRNGIREDEEDDQNSADKTATASVSGSRRRRISHDHNYEKDEEEERSEKNDEPSEADAEEGEHLNGEEASRTDRGAQHNPTYPQFAYHLGIGPSSILVTRNGNDPPPTYPSAGVLADLYARHLPHSYNAQRPAFSTEYIPSPLPAAAAAAYHQHEMAMAAPSLIQHGAISQPPILIPSSLRYHPDPRHPGLVLISEQQEVAAWRKEDAKSKTSSAPNGSCQSSASSHAPPSSSSHHAPPPVSHHSTMLAPPTTGSPTGAPPPGTIVLEGGARSTTFYPPHFHYPPPQDHHQQLQHYPHPPQYSLPMTHPAAATRIAGDTTVINSHDASIGFQEMADTNSSTSTNTIAITFATINSRHILRPRHAAIISSHDKMITIADDQHAHRPQKKFL
eukprot:CAMPEP_0119551706 /NCGR_PEP_ID=MMETSP1352-20130426/4886_1 /TAXON_ID=265584 /ORGANISM="Stauroneis constricta, Strain CCMP1120" /LENGTH=1009 /DNA_ID=CAMNT_0007597809 /DNA_START=15 /DNA_END=3041 /DNA_ORIENTATION=-